MNALDIKLDIKDTLPDKPSELISVALDDLEACENDSNYHINMNRWHLPGRFNNTSKKCQVCFAGAVMTQSLKIQKEENFIPDHFNKSIQNKLRALDYFRVGRISEALKIMGYEEYIILNESVNPYNSNQTVYAANNSPNAKDKKAFKNDMKRIISILENHGL